MTKEADYYIQNALESLTELQLYNIDNDSKEQIESIVGVLLNIKDLITVQEN
mgnify:CR=1 FL=1